MRRIKERKSKKGLKKTKKKGNTRELQGRREPVRMVLMD
jgi:hypothetical protein